MQDMMIGVDLAKNVFQMHAALRTGEVQFRKSSRASSSPRSWRGRPLAW